MTASIRQLWLPSDPEAPSFRAGRVHTRDLPLALTGKTSAQRCALIEAAAIEVVAFAEQHNATVVLEALDFARKKRELQQERDRDTHGHKRYARMLSSLPYALIRTSIQRRAQRCGVPTRSVNPAYTSLIGEVNYARRYGLTRHQAAAVVIARRAPRFSERISYIHGLRGSKRILPAPEEAGKHVWRQWAKIHRERTASAKAARKEHLAHPPGP